MRSGPFSHPGQTIMEVMIAVFIMSLALVAILSLVTYTVYGQQVSEQQIIAQQLAREGIEVARNFRDSAWLAGVPMSDPLYPFSNLPTNLGEVDFNPATNVWNPEICSGFCFWNPPNFPTLFRLYANGGVYREESSGGVGTPFARRLQLHHLCRAADGSESVVTSGACAADSERVGTRVTASVAWVDRTQLRQVMLSENFYAWR